MNTSLVRALSLIITLLSNGININAYGTGVPNVGHVANGADAISFPGETQRRTAYGVQADAPTHQSQNVSVEYKINNLIPPVDFVQKISTINVSDLLLNFVDDYEEDSILASRFGTADVERSAAVTPKPATCMPELQTVQLIDEQQDPSVIYIPSCTRIERCGGCCSHNLLSCQAKESEIVHFKVIKTQFAPGNRLKFVGKEIVHVEKHTKCHCACRVQPKDCTEVQVYSAEECRCKCANLDEERKCHANSNKKLWDYTTCSCRCRNAQVCSTGFMYDAINCRCSPIPKRRHVIERQPQPVHEEEKQQQAEQEEQFGFQKTIDEYDY